MHVPSAVEALDRQVLAQAEDSQSLFFGRERELAALAKMLVASGSATRSALVQGEAGIGKTRLMDEFLRLAEGKGFRVLRGHCYHVLEAGAYLPFLQILRQLHPERSSDGLLPRGLIEEAISDVARRDWGHEDAVARRARFLNALTDLILQAAAGFQTVLCIEDVQWADIGSLLVLNNLLDVRATSLVIVCTARTDEPTDPEHRQLVARIEQKGRRIVLQGLRRTEICHLVDSLIGPGVVSDEELKALESFTNGNPMFIAELVSHLRETGLLQRHGLSEAIQRGRAPDRLGHVVDLRLRSLIPSARTTLSVCAVVGMEFPLVLVAQALGRHESEVEDDVEGCAALGIMKRVDDAAPWRYKFAHPLFAMRVYDLQRPAVRRGLHRRVAEAATCDGPALPVPELARHYALGFGAERAREVISYCKAAAEEAERLYAYETAARFWELAITCARPRSVRLRAELYGSLGWALWSASKWDQAREAWEEAISLFEKIGRHTVAADLCVALGEMHRWSSELSESERWLTRALELGLGDASRRSRALALLGGIRQFRSASSGRQLLEEADAIRKARGGDPVSTYWLSYGFLIGGVQERAYSVAKDGLVEAQRRNDSSATVLLAASLFHHELGQLHLKAARSYLRIIKAATDPNDAPALIRSLLCETLLWAYVGRWDRVLQTCEQWMARVRLASRFQVATARLCWAEAKYALGELTSAHDAMVRSLADLGDMHHLGALYLARVLLRLGQKSEAASIAHQYHQSAAGSPRPTSAARRAILGEVCSSLDEPELWRQSYDLLRDETGPLIMAYSPIGVRRILGRLASRLGLWREAIEHFEEAVQQLRNGGAQWELVQALVDYANMRRSRGRKGDLTKAKALELQARAILTELGIQDSASNATPTSSFDGNRFGLTNRELELLALVARGRRNREIAEELVLSYRTVYGHLNNIFNKMGVDNRTEAVFVAVQEGLIGPLAGSSGGR